MDERDIEYLGKTDKSPQGDSPTAWRDRASGDFFVQGYVVDDPAVQNELLAASGKPVVPPGETLIRIPSDMAKYFTEER